MRYEGLTCPGCGNVFMEDDDVVVCPICGSPQHRSCWESAGGCVNAQLHDEGYEWKMPARLLNSEEEKPEEERPPIICPTCGMKNPAGSQRCSSCGQRFTIFGYNVFDAQNELEQKEQQEKLEKQRKRDGSSNEETDSGAQPLDSEVEYTGYNTGSAYGGATDIDGVSADDLAEYVRVNHLVYIRKFDRIVNQNKKFTWNWAAFFLAPYWFFYRKLVKPGIIFLSLSFVISLAFYQPMTKIYESYYDIYSSVSEAENLTEDEMAEASNRIYSLISDNLPVLILMAASGLVLRVICAFTADRLYKRKAISDIKRLRSEPMEEREFRLYMMKLGGISYFYALGSLLAEQLLSTIISYIIN